MPIRSLSKPSGSILCPTEIMLGLIPSVLNPWAFASASIVVSKISFVSLIFPVKSISIKSDFFIVILLRIGSGF